MQPLTAPPRQGFTVEQVTASLTGPRLDPDFGVELLAPDLTLIEDISADVAKAGAKVSRNNLADIHGTCNLSISRELAWGRDRIRPYMLLNGCRWNQGVFVFTTPDAALGETPRTWQATGYDQLHLLQRNIGNSYAVPAGANVLAAVRAAITAAGVLAPVLLDSAGAGKVLAKARVWPLTSSESPSWLRVVNDLLASVGYRGVWCDWDGAFRAGPYVLPSARPSEWLLVVGDPHAGIVAEDRQVARDVWGVPNQMSFIRNGLDFTPTEGVGRYTVSNPSDGLSSIASVGVNPAPAVFLDAVSQADLVTQGDRLFAAATRVGEVLSLKLSPMPALWHADICTYSDADLGPDRKVLVRSWELPLSGEDGSLVVETVA